MSLMLRLRQQTRAALGSLKLRITIGSVLALSLGIGLTTLLLVNQTERDTLAAARESEISEASRTAAALSRQAVELQRALSISAQRLDLRLLDDPQALDQYLQNLPILRTLFSSLYVVDAQGRMRVLLDADGLRHPGIDLSDRVYVQRTLKEGRPIISPLLQSRVHGEPIIAFTHPLVSEDGVRGMLAGSLDLSRRDLLISLVDPGSDSDDALRVVSDGRGRILAHPNRSLVMSPLTADPRLAAAAERWKESGSPIEPSALTVIEAKDVVTAGGVSGPDWIVWRAVDQEQLFAPLHAARRHALAWAGVLIAASSLLVLISLHILLRPLKRVQERAARLFDHGLDPNAGWPSVGGEIGDLARALRKIGTERARLEASNSHLLQQLGSVMSNAPVGIAFTRAKQFELVSAEFCLLLGRTETELLGQPTHIIYDSYAEFEALGPKVAIAFAAGEPFVGDVRMRRVGGEPFWAHLRGRPVDTEDMAAGTIWTITDISDEVAARNELEWAANHDPLTGLVNRQVFESRLRRCIQGGPAALPAALLMIDLDHFKQINDRAGHAAGDEVLCAVAQTLGSRTRTRDLAARLGGDEFAVLLEHCPIDAALRLAAELGDAIGALAPLHADPVRRFGASIGVAALRPETLDVADWMRAADEACYDAKGTGRGRVSAQSRPAPLRIVRG